MYSFFFINQSNLQMRSIISILRQQYVQHTLARLQYKLGQTRQLNQTKLHLTKATQTSTQKCFSVRTYLFKNIYCVFQIKQSNMCYSNGSHLKYGFASCCKCIFSEKLLFETFLITTTFFCCLFYRLYEAHSDNTSEIKAYFTYEYVKSSLNYTELACSM